MSRECVAWFYIPRIPCCSSFPWPLTRPWSSKWNESVRIKREQQGKWENFLTIWAGCIWQWDLSSPIPVISDSEAQPPLFWIVDCAPAWVKTIKRRMCDLLLKMRDGKATTKEVNELLSFLLKIREKCWERKHWTRIHQGHPKKTNTTPGTQWRSGNCDEEFVWSPLTLFWLEQSCAVVFVWCVFFEKKKRAKKGATTRNQTNNHKLIEYKESRMKVELERRENGWESAKKIIHPRSREKTQRIDNELITTQSNADERITNPLPKWNSRVE